MNENDLMEIEVEREGTKIKIRKGSSDAFEPVRQFPVGYQIETQPSSSKSDEAVKAVNVHHKEIKSPMVGTFYRAPSPETPPFVEVGQTVEVGQVVCIVEAMKLMNEIKSEVKGKILEAPVDNAQPVEFGQTLFTVEPL